MHNNRQTIRTFRVLIAEDEIAIANLIKNLIDFDRLNLELVGIAYDGRQAFDMIEKVRPDIIVTDISMPLMSGLDLIKETLERGCSPHFIIISGMTHFEYALSAIRMGVEDYLLKPINRDELNDVLEKTVLKIADAEHLDYQIQKLNEDSALLEEKQRRSFITNLLYNRQSAEQITIDYLNTEYAYHFQPDSQFLVGITQIDGIGKLSLPEQNTVVEQLMRIFQTGIRNHCLDAEFYNKNNQFLFLLNFRSNERSMLLGTVSVIHEDLSNFVTTYEGVAASVCCGLSVAEPSGIPYSMETAYRILDARIMLGGTRTYFADQMLSRKGKPDFVVTESVLSGLRSWIEMKDQKSVSNALLQILHDAATNTKPWPWYLPEMYRQTVSVILTDLYQHRMIQENPTDAYMQYSDRMEQYYRIKPLTKFTVDFILELLPFSEDEDQEIHVIQTAKAYIQEHCGENLKLEDVASQVYLAPGYFGVLFKKEVGESFSAYLTTVRMEKAKEYLRDFSYAISEIAPMVGYQDKRYFSRLFREQVGVTPKEYRKINQI